MPPKKQHPPDTDNWNRIRLCHNASIVARLSSFDGKLELWTVGMEDALVMWILVYMVALAPSPMTILSSPLATTKETYVYGKLRICPTFVIFHLMEGR